MRKLVIYCDGGFGNRFNALVSGLVAARALDFQPQVVWPVNNWCGASYAELFEPALPVWDRELATFQADREQYHYLIVEDRLSLAERWTNPLKLPDLAAWRAFADEDPRDIFYYTALIPPAVAMDAVLAQIRALPLQRHLVERADRFAQQHGLTGEFFGVQIRKTDFGANGANDQQLFELLAKAGHQRFFVCSDDAAVEARFATLPNVVTFPKRAYVEKRVEGGWTALNADHSGRVYPCNVNRNATSVEDAVVDLLLLARSKVVRTSHSTFLNTALLLQAAGAHHDEPVPA